MSEPSAHRDTFAADHLPPRELWPTIEHTTDRLQQHPARINAAAALLDATIDRLGGDAPALRTPDGTVWSYDYLRRRSAQVAEVLVEDLGLQPGDRVLLRSPNNPWVVACWLGVLRAGGVVVTTMAALRARELEPVVRRTRPAVALVDHRHLDDVLALADGDGDGVADLTVVAVGGGADDDLVRRAEAKPGRFEPVDTSADDVALLGPTSGSTGAPKITMHTHRDLLSIDDTFGHLLELGPDDLLACTAPLAFTFGLGMLVVFPLRAGACALLTEQATPVEVASLVDRLGVTVLATAPTAYKQVLAAGEIERLGRLRLSVSAGEHLPQRTWEAVRAAIGLEVVNGIGATEMLHIFISTLGHPARAGATGKPVPGYRATVLGPDDRPLGPGEEGRLAVIGPVGCRYLDDERQRSYVVDGWNVTGDTFRIDEDGYFHYCARTDDMIVSSGYNIGGPEVEAVVNEHLDVVEAAVVGKPDPARGSVVCAFVVLADGVVGDAAKAREIQDFVKARLAPYKYPRDVRFTRSLPRNPSGKLQHFRLRQTLEENAS
jgi:2-aminobenzoate-CoA ligase